MKQPRTRVGAPEPVKIVLQRRPRPGLGTRFEEWVHSLVDAASKSPALQGSSVLIANNGEYFILLRFASQTALEAWVSSSEVLRLLETCEELAVATDQPQRRSGFETWFTLPGLPSPEMPPPKWKMAVVTWLAIFPQALALSLFLPADWPRLIGVALGTAIPVSTLTWWIMPKLTGILQHWLYSPSESRGASTRVNTQDRGSSAAPSP
jgi:antibiotic biosynthesis monooxygenase (ABM) superfamily enzyme